MGYGFRNYGYRRPSYEMWSGGGGPRGLNWFITPTIKWLIIINLCVLLLREALAAVSPPGAVMFDAFFGMVPGRVVYGFVWQLVTSQFLHADFWHLFFNMFGLWMFGRFLEQAWGPRRFLWFYLLAGATGDVFSMAARWFSYYSGWIGYEDLYMPSIGASGAVFGILVAFGLLFPRIPVYLSFLFPIPAWLFVGIYAAVQIASAPHQFGPGGGTDYMAHVGGMVFGLFYLKGPRRILFGLRTVYANWQLNRARRKFRVYVREAEERDRRPERPEDWIN